MTVAASGASALLAALLAVAGALKAGRPAASAAALRKLLPARLRTGARAVARALGAVELLTAAGLIVASGAAAVGVAGWTLLLGLGFTAAVEAAIRKGAACGCWGSLSTGQAGGAETARAVGVAALAVFVLAARLRGWTGAAYEHLGAAALAWTLLLGVAWFAGAWIGALVRPTPTKRKDVAVSLLRGFVVGPGGVDARPAPHPAAVFGHTRRRDLRRLAKHPTVMRALEHAARSGGLDWRAALVLHPTTDEGTPVGGRVVVAGGPAGHLRVVQTSTGSVAVTGVLGGARVIGSDTGFAVLPPNRMPPPARVP